MCLTKQSSGSRSHHSQHVEVIWKLTRLSEPSSAQDRPKRSRSRNARSYEISRRSSSLAISTDSHSCWFLYTIIWLVRKPIKDRFDIASSDFFSPYQLQSKQGPAKKATYRPLQIARLNCFPNSQPRFRQRANGSKVFQPIGVNTEGVLSTSVYFLCFFGKVFGRQASEKNRV